MKTAKMMKGAFWLFSALPRYRIGYYNKVTWTRVQKCDWNITIKTSQYNIKFN